MGVDLCGIASIDRFYEAPEGFHPCDVLPRCKSVIVFAKKWPIGTLNCKTTIPYTITRNVIINELDTLSVQFCDMMENNGIIAIPTGTISPLIVDTKTERTRSIVSSKHSAVFAGLGWIGKNTLLITPEYGNMVCLNAILTDAILEPDKILYDNPCEDDCSLCIDNCPVNALGNPEMNQYTCWDYSYDNSKFTCYKCRVICPHCFGTKNEHI